MLTIHPEFTREDRPYRILVHESGDPATAPDEAYYASKQNLATGYAEDYWNTYAPALVRVLNGDEVVCEFES